MHKRLPWIAVFLIVALPALAAPPLSDDDRQRLADGTTDGDGLLDEQDGLYVLLRNAATWQGDDFAGDGEEAAAPLPDYDHIKANLYAARGSVYLIEGWLAQADRYPTTDNHERDALVRAGDPAWGDQVTRWTLVTKENDPGSTVIVLFNDPRAQMVRPGKQAKVRVAARFYKLWTIPSANGQPFTYPVFVGGAAQVVADTAAAPTSSGPSTRTVMTIALVLVAGSFVAIRYMLNKRAAGGSRLRERLEAIRREREYYEHEEENDEETDASPALPQDPVSALDALRDRHETPD